MLRIRLKRVGRKNDPHYQVVVMPRTNAAKGHITAKLGWYDPKTKQANIDKEAALKWLSHGAQPTNSAAKVLVAQKISHPLIKVEKYTPKAPKKKSKGEKKTPALTESAEKPIIEKSDELETKEEAPEVTDEEVGNKK